MDTRFDTPIEVTEECASQTEAQRCGTTLTKGASTIAKTLSTDETIDCEEVLREAQAIRKRREADTRPEITTGTSISGQVTNFHTPVTVPLFCYVDSILEQFLFSFQWIL